MNTTIKTGLAAFLLLAISCKKENNTIRSSYTTGDAIVEINDPGVQAYKRIGSQKWMTTNLNVSHYRNGDIIPQVKGKAAWAALTTGAWCWYNNNSDSGAIYGRLYNWYAVNDPRGLAPAGSHVPSDAEWNILSVYLGGDAVSGGKLKDTGTRHWFPPNFGATNQSGFTGLPGGYRYYDGSFFNVNFYGFFWSSTESPPNGARYRDLLYNAGGLAGSALNKQCGFAVRCIKD